MKKHNLFLLAASLVIGASAHAATGYNASKLNLNGQRGIATDINNNGTVAGTLFSDLSEAPWCTNTKRQPFMHKNGALTVIGTETSANCIGPQLPLSINNSDVIAGALNSQAYHYQNGALSLLNNGASGAEAINSGGLAGGNVGTCGASAALFQNGTTTTIYNGSCGSYGGTSASVIALNDSGTALVRTYGPMGTGDSKLYTNGNIQNLPSIDFNSSALYAKDINNAGHIVGTYNGSAFFWNGTTRIALGDFVNQQGTHTVTPTAINNNDVIVGIATNNSNGSKRGVIYENGQWIDLNTKAGNAGFWINTAEDINDSGAIVGEYYDGSYGGYKLTPFIAEIIRRTVIFIYGTTQLGQDMFIRGGLDWNQAKSLMGKDCAANPVDVNKWLCAIPMTHNGKFANETSRVNDKFLDWYGGEPNQGNVQGSPLVWTTNAWPADWGPKKTVANDGYGEDPQNTWGGHYWKLDVQMDCSKTYNGWFELKSFISNGPGWESNVSQTGTPYPSINHFGQCGKINKFVRGSSSVEIRDF